MVALRAARALVCAGVLALGWQITAAADPPPGIARIEARSSDLLAVGTVQGDRMTIHVSRILDNAPVRDAAVALTLRGSTHPATAMSDGGYSVRTPDLNLPGTASVLIAVTTGPTHEELKGTLEIGDGAAKPEDRNSARQLGWWVLNFAVCIGFLMLWRRRKSTGA
jgi:hypothetical protein